MTPPDRLWNLSYDELFRSTAVDRRYRTAAKCARQLAAVLAAPDDVVRLRGVWESTGWSQDKLEWTRLDPHELLASVADEMDADDDRLGPVEQYTAIAAAWEASREREAEKA